MQPSGRHSKRIAHHDLLSSIHSDALLLLRRLGHELIIADGVKLRAFALSDHDDQVWAHLDWELKLNEPVQAMADTSTGVLVASTVSDETILSLVDRGNISKVVSVCGSLSALTASSTEAVIATKETGTSAGRLWRIDIAHKTIIAEKPLTNSQRGGTMAHSC